MFSMRELMAIQEALLHRVSTPDDEMLLDQGDLPLASDYQNALSTVNMLIERLHKIERFVAPMETK